MRRTLLRVGAVTGTALVSAALIAPVGASAVEGEFAAQADAGQLYVDAVNFNALTAEPPVNSLATIGVSPTQAQVATPDGLGGGVLSRGFGQNLDLSVADQEVPLDLSTAEQTAPPDNTDPAVTQLIPLDAAAPLLTGAVSESTALARDPQAVSCPDQDGRATISRGTSTTTNLGVLEIEEGTELLSVETNDGTLTSTSETFVGPDGQIISEARGQTAAVNIADEVRVDVVNPILTATATGTDGGASVEYTGEVRVNGDKIAGVQENQISLDALVDVLTPVDEQVLNTLFGPIDEQVLSQVESGLQPVLEPLGIGELTLPDLVELINNDTIELDEVGGLEPVVRVTAGQLENVQTTDDGQQASGEVKTVRIELNIVSSLAGTEVPILTTHLMPLAASAQAPAGGLDCGDVAADQPYDITKDAPATVGPNESFTFDIGVTNQSGCDLTAVTVTDTITFNDGTTGFTVDSAGQGGTVDGNVVTWDVGEMPAGSTETFTVDVTSGTTAGSFDDTVEVVGTCEDDGDTTGSFTLPDTPTVLLPSNDGGVAPDNTTADELPNTGGGMALLGLGAIAAAARLRRRS